MRLQTDSRNDYSVKRQLANLIEKICSVKPGKKADKQPLVHLKSYMQMIQANLEQVKGQDLPMEALLFAFGYLHEKFAWSGQADMTALVQNILETYVYPCLHHQNPILQSRACWVYGKYG